MTLTSRMGAVWVQPGGPNNPIYYLSCKEVGPLTLDDGRLTLVSVFDPALGDWIAGAHVRVTPGLISLDIAGLMSESLDWLETLVCPFSLYILQRDCGRADNFSNYVRGFILANVNRVERSYSSLVLQTDAPSIFSAALQAYPPALMVAPLGVFACPDTPGDTLNGVAFNAVADCGACDDPVAAGTIGMVVGNSPGAAAVIRYTIDGGNAWAAVAASPFAAADHAFAVAHYMVGATHRFLVSQYGSGLAIWGLVAYTDDYGASWSPVSIGAGREGHGAVSGNGLFALDGHHIWLASSNGHLYQSGDNGVTWASSVIPLAMRLQKTTDNGATYADYSVAVTDEDITTYADLDALDDVAAGDWFVVGADDKFTGAAFRMTANVNVTDNRTLTVEFYDSTVPPPNWTAVAGLVDLTVAVVTRTLSGSGQVTWNAPGVNWVQSAINGITKYWTRFSVNDVLSATVEIAECSTVKDYSCIHFDTTGRYGIAGSIEDIISLSDDGGITWANAPADTGTGGDILCCTRFDKNRMWVGTDDGRLFYTTDGAVTWIERTGWPGCGTGAVRSLVWANEHEGFMAYNTAGPVGHINVTIDGGVTWTRLTTPVNIGLNHICTAGGQDGFAVGDIAGGTGITFKIT